MLAITAATFALLVTAVLFSVDATFFYPRIETDQLLYLLKAKSLVETGSTAARLSINTDPFPYASMPGVLRAPFLLMFSEFDHQLRAIQIANLAIVTAIGVMSAYMLSWVLPRSAHRAGIAFAFGFMLLSHDWLGNIFVPLADAPYAALTLGCMILAAISLSSRTPLARRPGAIALFCTLFIVACFVRYTAPALLAIVALLAWGRRKGHRIPVRATMAAAGVVALLLAGVLAVDSGAILGRYVGEAKEMTLTANWIDVTLHLLTSSLPAQVIPVFNLGFQVHPLIEGVRPLMGTTPRDIAWSIAGFMVSAVVIRGMIINRRRILPELATFLVALPILAVLTPSTTRYLMSYQPVIWMCFFTGLASITEAQRARASAAQVRAAAGAIVLMLVGGVMFLRAERTARTAGGETSWNPAATAFAYADDVENTFRSLRNFLEGLPADTTLLIGAPGEYGRYTVIAGRSYYIPDAELRAVAGDTPVYAVMTCSTRASCRDFDHLLARQTRRIERYDAFSYSTAFDYRTANARAIVRRVMPAPPRPLADDIWYPYSASGRTPR